MRLAIIAVCAFFVAGCAAKSESDRGWMRFDDLSIDDADLTQAQTFCQEEIDKSYSKAYDQPSIYNRCMADHAYQPAEKRGHLGRSKHTVDDRKCQSRLQMLLGARCANASATAPAAWPRWLRSAAPRAAN